MKKKQRKKDLMGRLIREEAVKAVLELIGEDAAVTMDEVALRCGVAKGTLYNYFKNKKDLLAFAHEEIIIPIKKRDYKLFDAAASPEDKILAFVDRVFDFHQQFPLYFKFVQSQRSAAEAIQERMTLAILPLVKVCEDGIRKGVFPDADPHVMAAGIFGTVVGTMETLGHRKTPVKDMEHLKKDVVSLLERLMLKEKE